MSRPAAPGRIGIGLIGSGFNAGFHLQAFRAVREADVRGIWSPDPKKAAAAAARARDYDVGATIAASRTSRRSSMRSGVAAGRSWASPAKSRSRAPSRRRSASSTS
jgi:hypothetical protein